jgi:subtilisin family serine protease
VEVAAAAKGQVIPWGVYRILGGNVDAVWASYTGAHVKVAVLDTGVDASHPDLVGNVKGGMSTQNYTRGSYYDDEGHGTEVAGRIAEVNNSIGGVGVAPGADLYAVKVLDKHLGGNASNIIEGLQWCVANRMDVVNMSLGSSTYSRAFDEAVRQTIAAGVVVVAGAGNEGLTSKPGVLYPAKFPGVIAVSAVSASSATDTLPIAPFSCRGPEVDLAAPGVDVVSTYPGGLYVVDSGTSFASPHVAGVAALVLTSPIGADDLNHNGVWDPNEVELRLERTAQDLGDPGRDTLYGYGFVRADLAVVAP